MLMPILRHADDAIISAIIIDADADDVEARADAMMLITRAIMPICCAIIYYALIILMLPLRHLPMPLMLMLIYDDAADVDYAYVDIADMPAIADAAPCLCFRCHY